MKKIAVAFFLLAITTITIVAAANTKQPTTDQCHREWNVFYETMP